MRSQPRFNWQQDPASFSAQLFRVDFGKFTLPYVVISLRQLCFVDFYVIEL